MVQAITCLACMRRGAHSHGGNDKVFADAPQASSRHASSRSWSSYSPRDRKNDSGASWRESTPHPSARQSRAAVSCRYSCAIPISNRGNRLPRTIRPRPTDPGRNPTHAGYSFAAPKQCAPPIWCPHSPTHRVFSATSPWPPLDSPQAQGPSLPHQLPPHKRSPLAQGRPSV